MHDAPIYFRNHVSVLFSAQTYPNKLPELLIKSELSRSPSNGRHAFFCVQFIPALDNRCLVQVVFQVNIHFNFVLPVEQCSRMDDSPDDPGISNAWDSSDSRGASGGGPSRGA